MAVIDKVLLLDNFWLKELGGYFGYRRWANARPVRIFFAFVQAQLVTQPLDLRILRISRTNVLSAAA